MRPETKTHAKRKRSEFSAQVQLDERNACCAKLVKVEDGCGVHDSDLKIADRVSCDHSQEYVRDALVTPQEEREQRDTRVDARAASEHDIYADLWLCGAHEQSPLEESDTGDFLPF